MEITELHKRLWLFITPKEKMQGCDYILYNQRHHQQGQKVNRSAGEDISALYGKDLLPWYKHVLVSKWKNHE